MALFTGSLWLVFPAMALPFAIAFASHILLDMMNKKSVRLLYPKGFCFGMSYADRFANKLFTVAGSIWMVVIILMCLKRG